MKKNGINNIFVVKYYAEGNDDITISSLETSAIDFQIEGDKPHFSFTEFEDVKTSFDISVYLSYIYTFIYLSYIYLY